MAGDGGHGLSVRGDGGEVRWSYHRAATLGAWTLTVTRGTPDAPSPLARDLRAEIRTVEPWAIRQRPLTFIVVRPETVWRWPVLALEVVDEGRTLVAQLGAKEGTSHVAIRSA